MEVQPLHCPNLAVLNPIQHSEIFGTPCCAERKHHDCDTRRRKYDGSSSSF